MNCLNMVELLERKEKKQRAKIVEIISEAADLGNWSTAAKLVDLFEITADEYSDFIVRMYRSKQYDAEDFVIAVTECSDIFKIKFDDLKDEVKRIYLEHEARYI